MLDARELFQIEWFSTRNATNINIFFLIVINDFIVIWMAALSMLNLNNNKNCWYCEDVSLWYVKDTWYVFQMCGK